MICTPAVLATRWQGHRIIDPAQRQPATLSAALLVGRDAGASLTQFGDLIGAEIVSFSDLSLLEQAYRFAELEPDTFVHSSDSYSPHSKDYLLTQLRARRRKGRCWSDSSSTSKALTRTRS